MASASFDLMNSGIGNYKSMLGNQQGLMQMQQQAAIHQQNYQAIMAQQQYHPGQIVYYNPNGTTQTSDSIKKKGGVMKSFREYLDKHRDLIFTVALVFIADHYLLNGALKERIKKLLHGLLDKAEANMHKEIAQ